MSAATPPGGPWLSVLVPAHNVLPYLRECVQSVLAEADEGVELVLLDDSSSDGSLQEAQRLQHEQGERIRLLRNARNLGIGGTRNALLDAARGRYVWFIDSDDSIARGALPRLRALLHAADAPDLVFCDYRVLRERPSLKHRLRGEHHRAGLVSPPRRRLSGGPALLQALLAGGNLFCWTQVARRTLWADGLRFPAGHSFEDMATLPHLVLRAASAWYEPEAWVTYRRRDDSLSARLTSASLQDLARALVGLREALLARYPDAPEATRFAVAHQAARNLMSVQRHARALPDVDALMRQARGHFAASVGDDLTLLWRGYARRGWWWRAWRLRRLL